MRPVKGKYIIALFMFGTFSTLLPLGNAWNTNVYAEDDSEQAIFIVYLKDGEKNLEGILKMRFSKKLSGFTEFGVIEIPFSNIQTIVPLDSTRQLMVSMKTGETAKVEITNSLYLVNAVYGKVDLSLDKIKKIQAKE